MEQEMQIDIDFPPLTAGKWSRVEHLKSSPVSLSLTFGLKTEPDCSVAMDESCENKIGWFRQSVSSQNGLDAHFNFSSLVVLRRGNGAWWEFFVVPESAEVRLTGGAGAAVCQSGHAGDGWRRDWIRTRLYWYRRAWSRTEMKRFAVRCSHCEDNFTSSGFHFITMKWF